jgi:hypothetical protein
MTLALEAFPSTRNGGTVQPSRPRPGSAEAESWFGNDFVLPIVALIVLTVVLTGPGLWSENWGWGWLERAFGRKEKKAPPEGPRAQPGQPKE